jgi:acyl-CoA thioester hydrolase
MHFIKRLEIRWRDMDGFGHVNNSTYLTYFEEARDEYFTGVLGDTVHGVVVRKVEVEFISGLTQEDDHVDVHVQVERIGTSSVSTHEWITAVSDGRLAADAHSVMVHTDAGRRASERWSDRDRGLLEALTVDGS